MSEQKFELTQIERIQDCTQDERTTTVQDFCQILGVKANRILNSEYRFAEYRISTHESRSTFEILLGTSWRTWVASLVTLLAIFIVILDLRGKGNFFFYGFFSLTALWTWARYGVAPQSVVRMMDIPPSLHQYPVTVSNMVNGKRLTSDMGVLTFVDGIIHFEGQKYGFSFDNRYVRRYLSGKSKSGSEFWVRWQKGDDSGTITFNVFNDVKEIGKHNRANFKFSLEQWLKGPSYPGGKFTFPPRKALK